MIHRHLDRLTVAADIRRTPRRRTLDGVMHRIVDHLTLVAVVLVFIGWALFLRPVMLGGGTTYMVVRGDSMNPTYHNGDFLVLQAQSAYHAGDVVAYHVPRGELGAGQLVVHRIVGGSAASGFVLRGDNNPAPDPWHPTSRDVAGKTWVQVPVIGRILLKLRQPALLAAGAATLFVVFVITGSASSETSQSRTRARTGATAQP